jgi:uncharacterized damage-inducible protein DinB
MNYTLKHALEILSKTPQVIAEQTQHLSDDWIFCNEGENTWSIFDIVGHLNHGEKTDWIARMQIILNQDPKNITFAPFDRFAQFETSKGKSLVDLLEEFKTLRTKNLALLQSAGITEEKLGLKAQHPALGEVTLRNLLSTWVAHDLNHLAQIQRVMAKQYSSEVGPWKQYLRILNA